MESAMDHMSFSDKNDKLVITKKNCKGDDGYKVFSIRIKEETVLNLEEIARQTNRTRNELIGIMLDFAIKNCVITP